VVNPTEALELTTTRIKLIHELPSRGMEMDRDGIEMNELFHSVEGVDLD